MRKSKIPVGWEALATELKTINIPQDLVGNKERWDYMRKPTAASEITPRPIRQHTRTAPETTTSPFQTPPKSAQKQSKGRSSPKLVNALNWDY